MDGTVTENAASEIRRPGVLWKTDAYLRQVWKEYCHRRLFVRFRKLRPIAKEWSLIRSITIDDRKRLRRHFLAQQRIILRNDRLSTIVIFAVIMFVVVSSIAIYYNLPDNLSILNVPLHATIDAPPQPVFVTIAAILFLALLVSAIVFRVIDAAPIWLLLLLVGGSLLSYAFVSDFVPVGECLIHMNLPYCPYYISNVVALLSWFFFGWLAIRVGKFVKTILDDRYPQEIISDNLFRIIVLLERGPSSVESISLRRILVARIERVALIVRSRLLSQIRTKEPLLATRRKQQAYLISRTVIERAIWLLTPTSRTGEDILSYFTTMMVALLDGNWDQFFDKPVEGMEEMAVPTKGWVLATLSRIGALIHGIFIAVAPIGAVYLIQHYEWEGKPIITLSDPIQTYIYAGLFVWVIIVIVSTIDPLFKERVETLKEIVGTLRGTGTKE
jgi:hypothetical protein